MLHLVDHQGDERRDDKAHAGHHHGRQLKSDALAAARGHEAERVVAAQNAANDVELNAAKIVVAPNFFEAAAAVVVGGRRGGVVGLGGLSLPAVYHGKKTVKISFGSVAVKHAAAHFVLFAPQKRHAIKRRGAVFRCKGYVGKDEPKTFGQFLAVGERYVFKWGKHLRNLGGCPRFAVARRRACGCFLLSNTRCRRPASS